MLNVTHWFEGLLENASRHASKGSSGMLEGLFESLYLAFEAGLQTFSKHFPNYSLKHPPKHPRKHTLKQLSKQLSMRNDKALILDNEMFIISKYHMYEYYNNQFHIITSSPIFHCIGGNGSNYIGALRVRK